MNDKWVVTLTNGALIIKVIVTWRTSEGALRRLKLFCDSTRYDVEGIISLAEYLEKFP